MTNTTTEGSKPAAAQEAVYRAPCVDENGVEWRPVVGFEQFYEVSSEGRIFSLRHNRLLSNNSIASHGYIKAFFHGDGKRCQTFAHRAVAEAFLGPADGREVNHLNGIRTDNRVENLDWVTRSENEIHSRYILGNLCEAVIAVSLRTGARVIFRSQAEAEAELCLPRDAVRRCLVGDFKSSMGWRFEKPSDSLAPVAAAPVELDVNAAVAEICKQWNMHEPDARRMCAVFAKHAITAKPDLHGHLLDMLGAKNHEDAGRIIGELHAAMSTPAAPGIDVERLRAVASNIRLAYDGYLPYVHGLADLLALIDASPKSGSDAAAWHSPDDLPDVAPGDMGWFWVAVKRANGMTYNFPASYLNHMLLSDENGTADEPVGGNRYNHGAADEMDGNFPATGWHSAQEHSEYDNVYMPLLSDGDELIGWRAVADFTMQATSAEVGA